MLNSNIYNAKVSKFYSSYSRNISTLHHRRNLVEWALKNSSSASYFPLKILKEIENQTRYKNFNLQLIMTHDTCTQAETWSQTGKTVNTKNISGMLLSCKGKANQA